MTRSTETSHFNRRRFLQASLLAGAGVLLAGCAGNSTPTVVPTTVAGNGGSPKRGGTLRIAFPGSPNTLDPAIMTLSEEYNATLAMYNNLVRVEHKLQIQPELATAWKASDDLKSWTFTLRDNVTFHHGKKFDAGDVVFTFKRMLDPKTASPARSVLGFLDGVEKVDERTVRFVLKEGNADLPLIAGFVQGRILPSDRSDEQIAKDPSGTGPFKFKEWNPGNYFVAERNPSYWEPGLPYLDEVRMVTMPEQAGQVAGLSGGAVDMIWQLGVEAVSGVQADPNLILLQTESGGYQPIVMRCDKPPFTDARVRMAMKLAADRPGMQQAVLQGLGSLGSDHPIAPISPFHADLEQRVQNIQRAKELLSEAGHPNGLDLELFTTPGRPGLVEQAVAYQEMAKAAGIRLKIQQIPNNVYWSDYWLKKDLYISNWNFRPSVDETLATTYESQAKWNESYYKNEQMDKLIVQARSEPDTEKRKALYAQAQKLLSDDGGVIVSFFRPVVSAIRNNVQGFNVHPATWADVRSVWLG